MGVLRLQKESGDLSGVEAGYPERECEKVGRAGKNRAPHLSDPDFEVNDLFLDLCNWDRVRFKD